MLIFDFLSSPFVLNRGARDSHKHKIARLSEFHAEDLHLVNATKFFWFVSMSKIDHRIIKASQIVLVEIPDEDQLDLQTYVRCQEHGIYKRTFNKNAKRTLNAEYLTSNLSQINLSFSYHLHPSATPHPLPRPVSPRRVWSCSCQQTVLRPTTPTWGVNNSWNCAQCSSVHPKIFFKNHTKII